jgi:glycosyltransferase involved in cell wall biosynthesis
VLEAMACGRPIVAADIPALRELVADERLGVIAARSPEAFADAICAALARPWDPEASAAHARAHTWERVAQAQLQVYRKVGARRAGVVVTTS